jgi:hypothetical protein
MFTYRFYFIVLLLYLLIVSGETIDMPPYRAHSHYLIKSIAFRDSDWEHSFRIVWGTDNMTATIYLPGYAMSENAEISSHDANQTTKGVAYVLPRH